MLESLSGRISSQETCNLLAQRIKPLDECQLNLVNDVVYSVDKNGDELIKDKFNTKIIRKDMWRFRLDVALDIEDMWLNDQAVNFSMALLQDRNASSNRKQNHFFNSFFLTKLLDDETKQYDYEKVRKWTKHFDVFACDKLFFPYNYERQHWAQVNLLYFY